MEPIILRGDVIRVVESSRSAEEALARLDSLPDSAVVAWNIETADVDTRRFHTAGTGGRVLCASAYSPDLGFIWIDGMRIGEDGEIDDSNLIKFKDYFENSKKYAKNNSIIRRFFID